MLQFDQFEVLTFDCYGTLIDWETGIWEALHPVLTTHQRSLSQEQALELYGEFETKAEAGEYQEYKAILRSVLENFGASLGFSPAPAELQGFSTSVKDWPAFPDSPTRCRRSTRDISWLLFPISTTTCSSFLSKSCRSSSIGSSLPNRPNPISPR